ncbi:hypothetical protein B0H14DRAFT_3875280 [Mycena olivaceomarginata]|nr:hypothetical protein B0H14DRAFT_3875280 [Mycena olivaceomarginata]
MKKKRSRAALAISDAHRSLMTFRRLEEEDPTTIRQDIEDEAAASDAADEPLRAPRRRANHHIVQDSESESNPDSEDSIDVRKIKQEAEDWEYAPPEYLDERTQPVPGLPVLEGDDVDREIMHTTAPQISLPGPLVKPASTVVAGPSTAPAHAVESQLTPDPHVSSSGSGYHRRPAEMSPR